MEYMISAKVGEALEKTKVYSSGWQRIRMTVRDLIGVKHPDYIKTFHRNDYPSPAPDWFGGWDSQLFS